jgi:hypothetical protein
MTINQGSKKILWLLVYVLWIVGDIEVAWGWDRRHLIFLGIALFGTVCVSFAELAPRQATISSAVAVLVSLFVFMFAPPIVPPEPWRGWLQPANDPTPENGCEEPQPVIQGLPPIPKGTPIMVIGHTGVRLSASVGKIRAISVGECKSVIFDRNKDGEIKVDAIFYDADSNYLGEVTDNGYDIPYSPKLVVEHSDNLSTLVVHDEHRQELLYVKYANRNAIKIRGIFHCPRPPGATITVTDKEIMLSLSHMGIRGTGCFTDVGTGFCEKCSN